MRDLGLTIILLGIVPLILLRPHVGVLAWAWVSLMNPHKEVYSYLADANLNFLIAGLTLSALIFSQEKRIPKLNSTLLVIMMFAVWTTITTFTALNYDMAFEYWYRTIKTFIFLGIIAVLIDRPSRIHALILVIVISLGYWGVVSAGQTVVTLGHAVLRGPLGTMIEDNNTLALALVMVLPLVEYCRYVSSRKLIRNTSLMAEVCLVVAILGTYSRGGLIALAAVSIAFLMRSKSRLLAAGLIAVSILGISMLPQQWSERMSSIETYNADTSFQGRLLAWKTAIRLGLDRPIVGAGYRATEDPATYGRYKSEGDTTTLRAVHDAYLQVLADHGFVGLGLFALMFFLAVRNCQWVVKRCSNTPDLYWLAYLATMMQIGFFGYAVGAIALSVAYFDLFLVLIVVSSLIREYAQREAAALENASNELTPQRIPATARLYARRGGQLRPAELGSDAGR